MTKLTEFCCQHPGSHVWMGDHPTGCVTWNRGRQWPKHCWLGPLSCNFVTETENTVVRLYLLLKLRWCKGRHGGEAVWMDREGRRWAKRKGGGHTCAETGIRGHVAPRSKDGRGQNCRRLSCSCWLASSESQFLGNVWPILSQGSLYLYSKLLLIIA